MECVLASVVLVVGLLLISFLVGARVPEHAHSPHKIACVALNNLIGLGKPFDDPMVLYESVT